MANNEITNFNPNKFLPDKKKEVNTDFDYARKNLIQIIETGLAGLEEFSSLAQQSQNARSYEVLANLLNTIASLNKDLLDISLKKKDVDKEEDSNENTSKITNNLFVGSTSELQRMLEDMKKNKE